MTDGASTTSPAAPDVRGQYRLPGGIGFKVSLYMMAALFIVVAVVGAFFFWEGKKDLDAEIRGRAMYMARELAALSAEDIVTGNRFELFKKISPPFAANEDTAAGRTLLYLMIYNNGGELMIGSTMTEVFFDADTYFYTLPSGSRAARGDVTLGRELVKRNDPVYSVTKDGVCDLLLPVMTGTERVGFVRVGISGQSYEEKFVGIVKKSAAAFLGILLVGLAFSRIIALSITKPISRLSEAAEKLSRQNWDAPITVRGSDEISSLGHRFNQMAETLKQREISLSRGNRDLFILHSAGLDLMESLDRTALLTKIAARAEDLVRADTMAVSVIDGADGMLKYIGVFGTRARLIRDRELPIEAGGIFNWLVSYGTPLLIPDAQNDFRLDGALMQSLGVKSLMTVPLWSSNEMVGLLTAVNKKGGVTFDKYDLRLFTVFSNLASAALQNASLYSDLKGKMEELKTAQEQLVRSTKMAAIGELSANVAHEINNPLTSVLGFASHLLKTLDLPEAPRKMLRMMEQETLRVRKIIRNLLDFARQRPARMQPQDVSVPLKETISLVQGIADASSVRISEEYPPEPVIANIDQNEIKQVFINIVNNALQAMPQGGSLHIRLGAEAGREAVIEFEDTGVGIAPENMPRIFEPFFSTKGDGDGTGLGLSISYRIIQNHGGRLEPESRPGKGTVFRIFLPLHLKKPEMESAAAE
jgi:signal transduction histidine kinase